MSHDLTLVTWSKVNVRMEASHCTSAPCLVSCLWVFFRWKYNVFKLSRDLPWIPHSGVLWIYGLELLALCHHPGNSCDHKHCDSDDAMFLICHLTSREHKGLCKFMGGSPLQWFTTSPSLVIVGLVQVEI